MKSHVRVAQAGTLLVVLQLLLIEYCAARRIAGRLASDSPADATPTIIVAVFTLWLICLFSVPAARHHLLVLGSRWKTQIALALPMLIVFLFVVGARKAQVGVDTPPFMEIFSRRLWGHLFLGADLVFIISFIVPGVAFFRYRGEPEPATPGEQTSAVAPTGPVQTGSPPAIPDPFAGSPVQPQPNRVQEAVFGKEPAVEPGLLRTLRRGLILVLGALVALAYYGMAWAQFIPEPERLVFVSGIKWPLIAAAIPYTLILVLLAPPSETKVGALSLPVRMTIAGGSLAGLLAFLLVPALGHGLPAFHSLIVRASEEQVDVTFESLGRYRDLRTCSRRFYINWDSAADDHIPLCRLPEDLWDELAPGDKLTLSGYSTAYGFRYTGIRRVTP